MDARMHWHDLWGREQYLSVLHTHLGYVSFILHLLGPSAAAILHWRKYVLISFYVFDSHYGLGQTISLWYTRRELCASFGFTSLWEVFIRCLFATSILEWNLHKLDSIFLQLHTQAHWKSSTCRSKCFHVGSFALPWFVYWTCSLSFSEEIMPLIRLQKPSLSRSLH